MTEGSADLIKPERVLVTPPPAKEFLPPPRTKETIKADMDAVDEEMKAFDRDHVPFLTSLTDEQRSKLGTIEESYYKGEIDIEAAVKLYPEDPELARQAVELSAEARNMDKKMRGLELEYTPYKREEIVARIKNLGARLDFRKALEAITEDAEKNDRLLSHAFSDPFREFFVLRRMEVAVLTGAIDGDNYRALQDKERTLSRLERNWQEGNFLRKWHARNYEIDSEFGENVGVKREDFFKELKGTIDALKDVQKVMRTYRSFNLPDYFSDDIFVGIGRGLGMERENMPDGFERIDFHPSLIHAARSFAIDRLGDLARKGFYLQTEENQKEYEKQFKNVRAEEVFSKFEIKGLEIGPGRKAYLEPKFLISGLRLGVPAFLVAGIAEVNHHGRAGIYDKDGNVVKAQGTHRIIFDGEGNYIKTVIDIYEDYDVPKDATEDEAITAYGNYFEVITHEIGHHFHNRLSYPELKAWETVMEKEPVAITPYVRFAKDQHEPTGKGEDFTESLQMFLTEPYTMSMIAPYRYNYFYLMCSRYMHPDDFAYLQAYNEKVWTSQKEINEKHGMTPEKIKEGIKGFQKSGSVILNDERLLKIKTP